MTPLGGSNLDSQQLWQAVASALSVSFQVPSASFLLKAALKKEPETDLY